MTQPSRSGLRRPVCVFARLLPAIPLLLGACTAEVPTGAEVTSVATAGPAPLLTTQRAPLYDQLRRTSCVVEGVVAAIKPTFDAWAGPRMLVQLREVTTRVGSCTATELTLPIAGGPLPSGRRLTVSDMPRFQEGGRYLVFLRNSAWFYAPTTLEPLRIEPVFGRNLLVSSAGYPVLGLDENGLVWGETRLFEPDPDLPDGKARPIQDIPASSVEAALEPTHLLTLLSALETARGLKPSGSFDPKPNPSHSAWDKTPTVVTPEGKGCEGTVSDECR